MRIAVLADIHSNLAALEAVIADIDTWNPHAVAVAGDIINRGPRPRECLDLILGRQQRDGWRVIRGNHERYLIEAIQQPAILSGIDASVRISVLWGVARLGGIDQLVGLPECESITGPDSSLVRIVHASMRHDRDNIFESTSDTELRKQIDAYAAVFCCGHTHWPVRRRVDSTLVVNVGSVGLPFDGDPRAAYARLNWDAGRWDANIMRVAYDRDRARADFEATGFLDACGATARIIQAELDDARGHIADWLTSYDARVRRGDLSAEESARQYLNDIASRSYSRG